MNSITVVDVSLALQHYEGPKQIARRSDVDMNGHVNNVTYLAWALETMPNDIYESHRVCEVTVELLTNWGTGWRCTNVFHEWLRFERVINVGLEMD